MQPRATLGAGVAAVRDDVLVPAVLVAAVALLVVVAAVAAVVAPGGRSALVQHLIGVSNSSQPVAP